MRKWFSEKWASIKAQWAKFEGWLERYFGPQDNRNLFGHLWDGTKVVVSAPVVIPVKAVKFAILTARNPKEAALRFRFQLSRIGEAAAAFIGIQKIEHPATEWRGAHTEWNAERMASFGLINLIGFVIGNATISAGFPLLGLSFVLVPTAFWAISGIRPAINAWKSHRFEAFLAKAALDDVNAENIARQNVVVNNAKLAEANDTSRIRKEQELQAMEDTHRLVAQALKEQAASYEARLKALEFVEEIKKEAEAAPVIHSRRQSTIVDRAMLSAMPQATTQTGNSEVRLINNEVAGEFIADETVLDAEFKEG